MDLSWFPNSDLGSFSKLHVRIQMPTYPQRKFKHDAHAQNGAKGPKFPRQGATKIAKVL